MNFRIADTFTDSLARLTGDEQKAVKTTAFDLQMNPANPGMSFHKLDKARDKNFWSVRVSRDIRLIVHRTPHSLLLCYVAHHDDAYAWAERRKIEVHPNTGAVQIVEIRERVEQITIQKYVEREPRGLTRAPLFAAVADGDLLSWGVPLEWLADVRTADNEDGLLALTDHLPAEAAEALIEFATGGIPKMPASSIAARSVVTDKQESMDLYSDFVDTTDTELLTDAFNHPDAQRRFRTIQSSDELERALDAPWDKWTIFLHPAQREWVDRNYSGPARVSGSAGTGKTIVALHRAVYLARAHPDSRVLLTTFSDALANALKVKLRRLVGNEPRLAERIDVYSMDAVGERLYKTAFGSLRRATSQEIATLLESTANAHPDHGFSAAFLRAEWNGVVDTWQLRSWDDYRDVQRLGRKTRLPESRRQTLWAIYADVLAALEADGKVTRAGMFVRLAGELTKRDRPPYDFAVVDESQDIDVAQLRFLAALGGNRPNALFFAGDLGQRIFQQPFSWKSQGVDIRGRARTLHVNYRTSHQIRMQADRLLDPVVADVDGNEEERKGTVSVFNGPEPEIRTFNDAARESAAVGAWLAARASEGVPPNEIAVFVRSSPEIRRAQVAVKASGLAGQTLDERMRIEPGKVAISTMHLAKGLEFKAVVVMACDDEVMPSQARITAISDDADLEEVYNTERHLLYVACTRARDQLWVSGVQPVSEFLEDLGSADAHNA
ncbi:MAG: UvrD-helicase domain-containing protein [Xanthomonadaceae bacterium]|nr:UvrD-helicase domain-containing protein [Xanthomonadaceae bacterium]